MVEGAKIVKFIDANKVLILTPDEELYTFDIDSDEGKIELNGEIELLESTQQQQQQQQRKNQHLLRINNLVLTPNKKQIIISRFNGSIEVYPIVNTETEAYVLTKLSSYPHLIECVNDENLLLLMKKTKYLNFSLMTKMVNY